MPFDSTPRMTPAVRVMPLPGMNVPTGENTERIPVRALGAPQTTWTGAPLPASTEQTRSRSALGCGFASMTEATTKPAMAAAGSVTCSTSRPIRVRVSTIVCRSAPAPDGVSRWSSSQESVNFMNGRAWRPRGAVSVGEAALLGTLRAIGQRAGRFA